MKIPILLPNIFDHPFTYKSSGKNLKFGDYVEVPFGKSKKIGIVWDEFEKNKNKEYLIKSIIRNPIRTFIRYLLQICFYQIFILYSTSFIHKILKNLSKTSNSFS